MNRKSFWRTLRSEFLFFASLFSIFTIFGATAYGMYYIPSESMLPTLAVGDRIAVNKFAYGYSRYTTPFSIGPELSTPTGRLFGRLPERGDIVVFKHPETRQTYIKRVVGLPGDEIMIREGRLYINGALTRRDLEDAYRYREHHGAVASVERFSEDLPGGRTHEILERGDDTFADEFGPVTVPENRLFVMGDNRDNSMDSRFEAPGVGFLPMEFLVGRAEYIVVSTNVLGGEDGLKQHRNRWFSKLQ